MQKITDQERIAMLSNPDIRPLSQAESCAHMLRGLISYHERMTMGDCPEKDPWVDELRFALACVQEKIK